MKRAFAALAVGAMLAAGTAGWAMRGPLVLTPEEEKAWKAEPAYGTVIPLGHIGGMCLGTFGIAHVKGFYADEGLKTEVYKFASKALNDAVGTGKVVACGNHIAAMLVPAVNGVRMKFTTGIQTGCKSLYALANGPINSTKDLKGRTVAVSTAIGGSDHNITLRFLNHDGVKPDDVKFKQVEASAVVLAMQNGEVDAATMSDQYAEKFLDDGVLKRIRSLTFDPDFSQEPCCIHAINLDFLQANPITARKLTNAHERASEWIMEHEEEAIDLLFANGWASGDRDLAPRMLKTYNFLISDELTETALRNILNDYKEFGLINSSLDTEETLKKIWEPVLKE